MIQMTEQPDNTFTLNIKAFGNYTTIIGDVHFNEQSDKFIAGINGQFNAQGYCAHEAILKSIEKKLGVEL
jgi:hypothetical protein